LGAGAWGGGDDLDLDLGDLGIPAVSLPFLRLPLCSSAQRACARLQDDSKKKKSASKGGAKKPKKPKGLGATVIDADDIQL
jgi:hypothetical protein